MSDRQVALIIRDGWGENHNAEHDSFNAVKNARTPVSDRIGKAYPRTEIMACGLDVGLPQGIVGNSEVGHQNIGAGRIVDQEIVRISRAFAKSEVRASPVVGVCLARLRETEGSLHLMGLASDAGVHSILEHLYGLLRIARADSVRKVLIHIFTDGRDTTPQSGMGYVRQIEEQCREIGVGRIATVCGRYWSMDRDRRWDRIEKAYACLTGRKAAAVASSGEAAVRHYYDNPIGGSLRGDEFVLPTWVVDQDDKPIGTVKDGDSVVFFNFRGDRPRELTRAFMEPAFDKFERGRKLDIFFATLTEYEKGLCPNIIFPKRPRMPNILGMYLSDLGIRQFRCAETEKYPHVTFFFNDYREEPFSGEDRRLIPSPKEVATYDQKPEMSARGVCKATVDAILQERYGLVVVNFANPDMVGHTGSFEAAVQACETTDDCLGDILLALEKVGGCAIVTSDHGNSDQMWDPVTNGPHTAHTLNPVELVIAGEGSESLRLVDRGCLADIAPTLLRLMAIEKPDEMTGECLIV